LVGALGFGAGNCSRQALRSLSRFEIQDFCPDLMVAEREAYKPFWRA
jgi:hypothetical protein